MLSLNQNLLSWDARDDNREAEGGALRGHPALHPSLCGLGVMGCSVFDLPRAGA